MKYIKNFIMWFLYITTGILIVVTVNTQLSDAEVLYKNILLHILFAGALTSLVTVIFGTSNSKTTKEFIIRSIIHYIALCTCMCFTGILFHWISFTPSEILFMAVCVFVVYVFTVSVYYITNVMEVNKINKRLKEKYGEAEE